MAFDPALAEDGSSAAAATLSEQRPKIALVLSGGGARGLSHIGVLKVLEELRVPVDCVVGTSMGALVGGIFATGVSPGHLEEILAEEDLVTLFDDDPPRKDITQSLRQYDYQSLFELSLGFDGTAFEIPPGASAGYKFELFLKELIGTGSSISNLDFDNLPTPFRAVATDLEQGGMVVFERGDLTKVMRASMSLPAIIAPTEIDGRLYVDGSLVRNFPVDIGRATCGDIVIAVNLAIKPRDRSELSNSLIVARRSMEILMDQNIAQSLSELTEDDVLIMPDLSGIDFTDFGLQAEIIKRGEVATRAMYSELTELSVSEAEYLAWEQTRLDRLLPSVHITSIKTRTNRTIHSEAILKDVHTETGEAFDLRKFNKDITDIYGRGDFAYVDYSIVPNEHNADIIIDATTKPWGPGFLKLGLSMASDFSSVAQINVAANYRRTWINSLGAEWRTDLQLGYDSLFRTEFIQPMQFRDGGFVSPYLEATRGFTQFYLEDVRVGDYKITRYQIGLDAGLSGIGGELRIGPFISAITGEPEFGIATDLVERDEVQQVGLELRGVYDQLDRYSFPGDGMRAELGITGTREHWGSDDEYTKAWILLTAAREFSGNIFQVHYEWGDEISDLDDLYTYDLFTLGGPGRMSGLYLDQLTGSFYNLATLQYYREILQLPSQIGRGVFAGITLETGRMDNDLMDKSRQWIQSGSVFFAVDTILGKLLLSAGHSSLDQNAVYLTIGNLY